MAESFVGTAEGVFRHKNWRGQRNNRQWRIADRKWTLDNHQCCLSELECKGRESRKQTLRTSVPLQDARVAMRSDLESEHKLTPTIDVSVLRSV